MTTDKPMPPQTSLIRWRDQRPTPWKNGGGLTTELLSSPAGASDFDWRLSIAEVATAGPFSAYPGIDRVIMLIEGEGMVLHVAGTQQRLVLREPFAFAGEDQVNCELTAGPTRDLNVMTRRGRAQARVTVHEETYALPVAADGARLLVIALEDALGVRVAGGELLALSRYDVLSTTADVVAGPGAFVTARIEVDTGSLPG